MLSSAKKKKEAHYWFNQISRTSLINKIWEEKIPKLNDRKKAYLWLSKQMRIDYRDCHIGMMDVPDCMRVVEVCIPVVKKFSSEQPAQD